MLLMRLWVEVSMRGTMVHSANASDRSKGTGTGKKHETCAEQRVNSTVRNMARNGL
jgi:hypothetical protein